MINKAATKPGGYRLARLLAAVVFIFAAYPLTATCLPERPPFGVVGGNESHALRTDPAERSKAKACLDRQSGCLPGKAAAELMLRGQAGKSSSGGAARAVVTPVQLPDLSMIRSGQNCSSSQAPDCRPQKAATQMIAPKEVGTETRALPERAQARPSGVALPDLARDRRFTKCRN